jgi:ABC transport system ATP-binding/permease protein
LFLLGPHPVLVDEALCERLDAPRPESEQVPLDAGRVIRVGRESDNDIVVRASMVSSLHLTLTVLADRSGYRLRDQRSTNGTFLNGRTHRIDEAVVRVGDVLFLGSYRLPVARIPDLVRRVAPSEFGSLEAVAGRRFIVGRDAKLVDTTIHSSIVSSRHAEVTVMPDGRFTIRDLGSSNGTFVDGERIRGTVVVEPSARVSLGSCAVSLDAEQGVVRRRFHGDVMLQAERVQVSVRDPRHPAGRHIVNDVSFTAFPTEFVGLMGPSGAGKTTLMLALNGYLPPTRGRSLLNGIDLYRSDGAFRGVIGYVPQDDIVYPQLTVYESLYFTARLRLPPDTSREEIDRRISRVLEQLEIPHTRDVRIGDAVDKGISGGERKRVNLAQELITEPSLLMLDEPTSGLASEDTINVMRLLRSLADEGRTILLTIHQPSLEAYRLMDNVLLLMRGRQVYYGPAYPDSIHFFHPTATEAERPQLLLDPGNALKPLALDQRAALAADPTGAAGQVDAAAEAREAAYRSTAPYREYVVERAVPESDDESAGAVATRPVGRTERRGTWRQWRVLTHRTALIKWKDRVNTAILLAQAPVIAAVLALVFAVSGSDQSGFERLERGPAALFLLVASAVWFGCSNSAREIVAERAVYRRERMVNVTLGAYAMSKLTVLSAICALQCLLLLGIAWVPLGFTGSFAATYGVLLLSSLAGLGMGLTLSALVTSVEAATALVPMLLIPQIILGGVIMPVHEMPDATRALSALTAARWGYEALLDVEFGDDDVGAIAEACEIPDCVWGIGATGARYTYYPGDPTDIDAAEERGGVSALGEGIVPAVAPVDRPICQALCPALQSGDEITPADRAFGADGGDPWRAAALDAIAVEGNAPDRWTAPTPAARTSLAACLGVLFGMVAFFTGLVIALLRARDVEAG